MNKMNGNLITEEALSLGDARTGWGECGTAQDLRVALVAWERQSGYVPKRWVSDAYGIAGRSKKERGAR